MRFCGFALRQSSASRRGHDGRRPVSARLAATRIVGVLRDAIVIPVLLGLMGIVGCGAQGIGQSDGPFHGNPDLKTAGVVQATGLTAGDFDGDGRPDLVVLSGKSEEIAVLLNQHGGSFKPMARVDAGMSASALTVGDFNEDGKLDVAICHHDTDEIWVLLGTGRGTFEPARKVHVPVKKPHAHRMVSADLNHDKHLDLVLAESDDNRVWVLLGDGQGGFVPSGGSPSSTGDHPYVVVVADFDGDGHLDFATPNWYGKSVSIFLGDATGHFKSAAQSPISGFTAPTALAAGDLTGDGVIDLALGSDDSREVRILVGDGKGGFGVGALPDLLARDDCFAPILADFNGDGRLDVVATGQNRALTFSYWINLGGGKFSAPHSLSCAASARTICVADLNSDGTPDLAVGTEDADEVQIWFGKKV